MTVTNLVPVPDDTDGWQYQTNTYIHLEPGLNYRNAQGQWIEAKEEFELLPEGAVARQGQHQVTLPANLNGNQPVQLVQPDGQVLTSRPHGLAYYDTATGEAVLLAEIKDCQGFQIAPNQILYTDAFDDIQADVRYTYTKGGFEQDIMLKAAPPAPEKYGLNSATTRLEVWSEFLSAPVPVRQVSVLKPGLMVGGRDESFTDDQLDFGAMRMGAGRAFQAGAQDESAVPVGKSWIKDNGRTFLIEAVELPAVEADLQLLPQTPDGASLKRKPGKRETALRRLPVTSKAVKREQAAIRPASKELLTALIGPALVLDYTILAGPTLSASYVFKGDTTYFINGQVSTVTSTTDITTFEGGAVIKYTNGISAKLTVNTPINWQGSLYRPVVFTSCNDNTVGEAIAHSTGSPGTAPGDFTALSLNGIAAGNTTVFNVAHVRISYALTAIALNSVSVQRHSIKHLQLIYCGTGVNVSSAALYVGNALFSGVSTCFTGSFTSPAPTPTIVAEHLTVDTATALNAGVFATSGLTLNNCLLWQAPVATSGSNPILKNTSTASVNPFKTLKGGGHYLADTSQFRDAGTDYIDAGLAGELRTLTTYAPVEQTGGFTIDTTLSPRALRDGDRPDLGYHYAPLDYIWSNQTLSAGKKLTLTNGVAVGFYGTVGLTANGLLYSTGLPNALNHLTLLNTVQENLQGIITSTTTFSIRTASVDNISAKFRFTDFSFLASATSGREISFYNNPIGDVSMFDCQLRGVYWGYIGSNYLHLLAMTNCVCERSIFTFGQGPNSSLVMNLALNLQNVLFSRCNVSLLHAGTTFGAWNIYDNVFDNCASASGGGLSLTEIGSYPTGSALTTLGYNGFIGTTAIGSTGNQVNLARDFVAGPLGPYYYPTVVAANSLANLLNADPTASRQPALLGLFQHTTRGDYQKEASTALDIGFHYLPTDNSGNPWDVDGDGIPDYQEDVNGNGTREGLETDWALYDTDGDGSNDLEEIKAGTNPLVSDFKPATVILSSTYSPSTRQLTVNWNAGKTTQKQLVIRARNASGDATPDPYENTYVYTKLQVSASPGNLPLATAIPATATSLTVTIPVGIQNFDPIMFDNEISLEDYPDAQIGFDEYNFDTGSSIFQHFTAQAFSSQAGSVIAQTIGLPSGTGYLTVKATYQSSDGTWINLPAGSTEGEQVALTSLASGRFAIPSDLVIPLKQVYYSISAFSTTHILLAKAVVCSVYFCPPYDASQVLYDNLKWKFRAGPRTYYLDVGHLGDPLALATWQTGWNAYDPVYSDFMSEYKIGVPVLGLYWPIQANYLYHDMEYDQALMGPTGDGTGTGIEGPVWYPDSQQYSFSYALSTPSLRYKYAAPTTATGQFPKNNSLLFSGSSSYIYNNSPNWGHQDGWGGSVFVNQYGWAVTDTRWLFHENGAYYATYADPGVDPVPADSDWWVLFEKFDPPILSPVGQAYSTASATWFDLDATPVVAQTVGAYGMFNFTKMSGKYYGVGEAFRVAQAWEHFSIQNQRNETFYGSYTRDGYMGLQWNDMMVADPITGAATATAAGFINEFGFVTATTPGNCLLRTKPTTLSTGGTPQSLPQFSLPAYIISVAVDKNHDGLMDLTYGGPDTTSLESPMLFWLNNNLDRNSWDIADEKQYEDDVKGVPGTLSGPNAPDSAYTGYVGTTEQRIIPCPRDLQDFARLWLCGFTPEMLSSLPAGSTIKLGVYEDPTTWQCPAIDLFEAIDSDGGTGYLTDATKSANQCNPNLAHYLGRLGSGGREIQLSASNWRGGHFVWCGVTSGKGEVTVTLVDPNGYPMAQSSAYINIQDLKTMYERWTVGENVSNPPWTAAQPAGNDLPTGVPPFLYPYNALKDAGTSYILYVHGWNMETWEKDRFAECAFKRLYWQGYQGRFGVFRWPTGNLFTGSLTDIIFDIRNYDNSEFAGWRSATGLFNKLKDLNGNYPGHVQLLAHSMGNVVAGEALRLAAASGLPVVSTYVASQAAISAHAYDASLGGQYLLQFQYNNPLISDSAERLSAPVVGPDSSTPVFNFGPETPNIYARTPLAMNSGGAGTRINYYNSHDFALAQPRWCYNQICKPDKAAFQLLYWFDGTPYDGVPNYTPGSSDDAYPWNHFFKGGGRAGTLIDIGTQDGLYEIMAYGAESRSTPLGSTPTSIMLSIDLGRSAHDIWPDDPTTSDPTKKYAAHYWHSAEFRGNYAEQQGYWKTLLSSIGFGLQ